MATGGSPLVKPGNSAHEFFVLRMIVGSLAGLIAVLVVVLPAAIHDATHGPKPVPPELEMETIIQWVVWPWSIFGILAGAALGYAWAYCADRLFRHRSTQS